MLPEPPSDKIRDIEASPHLLPTGLEVAAIGVVVVQLTNMAAAAIAQAAKDKTFFMMFEKIRCPVDSWLDGVRFLGW